MAIQYFVCLDFEATCWQERSARAYAEIIEFPAVLLNVSTGLIESEFHQFVRPTNHPQLSSYCIGLTGITQQQIDRANPFPNVFRDFQEWLNEVTVKKRLVFYTKDNLNRNVGQNATFCSWASFDLRHYFQLEMGYNHLVRPESMAVWIDFEVEYKKKCPGFWRFAHALQRMGIQRGGSAHSGIEDARDLAKLVVKLIRSGCASFTFQKL